MRKLRKAFLKDGFGLGAMVSAEAGPPGIRGHSQGWHRVRRHYISYGIFLVKNHIPTLQHVSDRQDAIKNYQDTLKFLVLGKGVWTKLEELSKPHCKILRHMAPQTS